ncbi:MAG: 2-iminoacetate synthase ThiH [Candidatus Omnitrophota bacterium]
MNFYDIYLKYRDLSFDELSHVGPYKQFIWSLSKEARNDLEYMAKTAHDLTLKFFGKTIQLYTPMYLSNYCENQCIYCGFNSKNNIERKKLTFDEIEKEAQFISSLGLKHILILTGESKSQSSLNYLKDCIKILKKYFTLISIEIYPLMEDEYIEIISNGVDGLTIYQETYSEIAYDKLHLSGPKKDYRFRLDAPERAAKAGMRNVNIGTLLGLSDFRKDVFLLGLHAEYLQDKFPQVEVSVSVPRIRNQVASFKPQYNVTDADLVQIILALRIFLPRAGITLSTRENANLRDNLLPLGITRMSAGSTTRVGGHILQYLRCDNSFQFEIEDKRTVAQMKAMLESKGYQPIFKDWVHI